MNYSCHRQWIDWNCPDEIMFFRFFQVISFYNLQVLPSYRPIWQQAQRSTKPWFFLQELKVRSCIMFSMTKYKKCNKVTTWFLDSSPHEVKKLLKKLAINVINHLILSVDDTLLGNCFHEVQVVISRCTTSYIVCVFC